METVDEHENRKKEKEYLVRGMGTHSPQNNLHNEF